MLTFTTLSPAEFMPSQTIRSKEQDEIARQTEEFLQRGGKVSEEKIIVRGPQPQRGPVAISISRDAKKPAKPKADSLRIKYSKHDGKHHAYLNGTEVGNGYFAESVARIALHAEIDKQKQAVAKA